MHRVVESWDPSRPSGIPALSWKTLEVCVHLNGSRTKPSRQVSTGDRLTIQKGPYSFSIVIDKLTRQRRPAEEARTLYTEDEQSALQRHALYKQRKLEGHSVRQRERRPDKRARRQIIQFKQQ